ncbi:MAG: tRNA (adenosine(37)-N6)-threonylcarbamoyltransferase complex transferase subunit TsaD [Proteobacteria bacterium]|nr:tRNA (adenosine(37)-N6)-threonylcarbamoyltransferase complex transferase subunit TsaD [Pseudomonadota bacterium]
MKILGIETSCDETAAAVVTDAREVLSDLVLSQLDAHRLFGGVVPEIAARAHIDHLDRLIAESMAEAGLGFEALDGVAATAGPGLIGAVMVGLMTGKAIAAARGIPLIAVNHLEGHALSIRLVEELAFPYLLLLVSGGHCQLLAVLGVGRYRRLGTTIDDAVGEAFDKAAKLLGLGFPGGPALERAALTGNPVRFDLPRPLLGRPGADFSFSGLKTALRHRVEELVEELGEAAFEDPTRADLAASFQAAVGDVLIDRTRNALRMVEGLGSNALVVAGGVAANRYLRARLEGLSAERAVRLLLPPLKLCTDNAAMIAWAGIERLEAGLTDRLDVAPRARWPLDPDAEAPQGAGAPGRLGAKA